MSLDQPTQSPDKKVDEPPQSEMSGQWIREQLKDVAGPAENNPPSPVALKSAEPQAETREDSAEDDALGPIMANLARNISQAVAKPIEDLERRRLAEGEQLSKRVTEQTERVDAIFAALQRMEEAGERLSETVNRQESAVREQSERASSRTQELKEELHRERDSLSESIGALRGELEGFAGRLSTSERNVEEQKSALARLEELEKQRGHALEDIGRLFEGLQGAFQRMSRQEKQGD